MTKRTDDMRSLLNILKDAEKTPLKENAVGSVVGGIAGGAVGEFVAGPVGAGFGSEIGSAVGGSFNNSSELDEGIMAMGLAAATIATCITKLDALLPLVAKYNEIKYNLLNAKHDLEQAQDGNLQENFGDFVERAIEEINNAADMCATTQSLNKLVEPLHKLSHWLDQGSRAEPEEIDEADFTALDAKIKQDGYDRERKSGEERLKKAVASDEERLKKRAEKVKKVEEDEIDEGLRDAAIGLGALGLGLGAGAAGGMAYQHQQDNAQVARFGAQSAEDSGIVHHEEEPLADKWKDAPTPDGGIWKESDMRNLINLVNEQTSDMAGADVRSNAFVPKSSPWETETSPMKNFQRWAPQAVLETKSNDPLDRDIDLSLTEEAIMEEFYDDPETGECYYAPGNAALGGPEDDDLADIEYWKAYILPTLPADIRNDESALSAHLNGFTDTMSQFTGANPYAFKHHIGDNDYGYDEAGALHNLSPEQREVRSKYGKIHEMGAASASAHAEELERFKQERNRMSIQHSPIKSGKRSIAENSFERQEQGIEGMTSYTPAFPAKGVEAEYYSDFDNDNGWGVYGSETGHCYGLYNNENEADKAALHMNSEKMNVVDEELMENFSVKDRVEHANGSKGTVVAINRRPGNLKTVSVKYDDGNVFNHNPEQKKIKKVNEGTFEGSPEDEAKDRAEAKKHGMTMAQWEKSPQDRKLDAEGQRKLDAKLTEWEDDDYDDDEDFEPDFDPEFDDDLDFAEPGRNSALRAATRDDPRDQPCPTCGEDNRLTRRDVAHGYQCNACADRAERGW